MNKEQITQISLLTQEVGNMVKKLEPETSPEWEALEKLTAAHKQLRSIDIQAISQQKMDL